MSAPAPRVENLKDAISPNKFTLVATPRVTMPTPTINTPKKDPKVPLAEWVHITQKKLSEIHQTPVRPSIEPPLKFSVESPHVISDEKPTPRYNLRSQNHVVLFAVIQNQHVVNLIINQEIRKRVEDIKLLRFKTRTVWRRSFTNK